MPDADWTANAACVGQDPAMWFGVSDKVGALSPSQRAAKRHALQTCASCPVRAECAEAGRDEAYGIWGGLTPADRERSTGLLPPKRSTRPRGVPQPERRIIEPHGHRSQYVSGCRCEACCAAEREYKRQYRAARRAARATRREDAA